MTNELPGPLRPSRALQLGQVVAKLGPQPAGRPAALSGGRRELSARAFSARDPAQKGHKCKPEARCAPKTRFRLPPIGAPSISLAGEIAPARFFDSICPAVPASWRGMLREDENHVFETIVSHEAKSPEVFGAGGCARARAGRAPRRAHWCNWQAVVGDESAR